MKKWLWGVFTGVLLVFILFITVAVITWKYRDRPPQVQANSTLVLDLRGDIPERSSPDIASQIFSPETARTFISVLEDIDKAAADRRIKAILLKPSDLQIGWARLQQLRSALERFRGKGKQVVAYIDVASGREYYLATVADKVYLSPVGFLDVKGMRSEVMFFKDTLSKLGIQADLEHIGKYKNFSDQFTSNRMSDAFREAQTSMLDSIYGNFISTVAAARKRTPEEMRNIIEQTGPFEAERAQQAGLVDQLLYEDQVLDQMKGDSKEPVRKISLAQYSKVPPSDAGLGGGGERIALVYAVGTITSGSDQADPLDGGNTLGARSMLSTLDKVADDKSVKGVILRIDSPGGDALASDTIWRALINLRTKKPIVISMSDTAASGGYYIAMTGDPIVAEPGTITGSIGIVYGKLNLRGLYDKIGINKEIISRGRFALLDSDYFPYSPEERARVQQMMTDFYSKFVGKVAVARKMTPEAVDALAQGRVWTGEQAKTNGLIDELGGIYRATELIKQKTGIKAEARVELVEYPPRRTLFEMILSRAQDGEAKLPFGLGEALARWRSAEELFRSSVLATMPFSIEFR